MALLAVSPEIFDAAEIGAFGSDGSAPD